MADVIRSVRQLEETGSSSPCVGSALDDRTAVEEQETIEMPDEISVDFLKQHARQLCVCLAWFSASLNRSTNSIYIVAFGLADSAKETVLSNLCGQNLFSPDKRRDGVRRYSAKINADIFKVTNFKVVVLDTPAFVPSRTDWALDTIDSYFEKKKCVPNFIVITANFSDRNLIRKESDFCRMLHSMRHPLKHALDNKYFNVILAVTHVDPATTREDTFMETIDSIVSFTQHHLGMFQVFPAIEVDSWNFSEDSFILPSGRPCWRSTLLCAQKNGRVLGQTIFSEILVRKRQSLKFDCVQLSPVGTESRNSYSTARDLVPADQETIADRLESHVKNHPERAKLREKAEDLVMLLRNAGCVLMSDLPKATEIGKLMTLIKYLVPRIDKEEEEILRSALGISAPDLKPVGIPLGCPYILQTNDLKNRITEKAPVGISSIGCLLQRNVIAMETGDSQLTWCQKSKDEFARLKLSELGITMANVQHLPSTLLKMEIGMDSGYYISDASSSSNVALLFQKSLYKLVLNHRHCCLDNDVEQELEGVLQESGFDENSKRWDTFFDEYGTHYVSEVQLGGSIMFLFSRQCAQSIFGQRLQGNLSLGSLSAVFDALAQERRASSASRGEFYVRGGMDVHLGNSLKEDLERFFEWQNSIPNKFVPLNRTMKLEKMTKLVKREWKEPVGKAIDKYYERKIPTGASHASAGECWLQ